MHKDSYGNREQNVINSVPYAIDEVKKGLGDVLKEYTEGRSVTQDSLNYINGTAENNFSNTGPISPFIDTGYGSDMGANSNVNQKKLVRTMDTPGFIPAPPVREEVNNNPYGQSSYGQNYGSYSDSYSSYQGPSNIGSATTLILIFTALLVTLVVLVCFMFYNYIGF